MQLLIRKSAIYISVLSIFTCFPIVLLWLGSAQGVAISLPDVLPILGAFIFLKLFRKRPVSSFTFCFILSFLSIAIALITGRFSINAILSFLFFFKSYFSFFVGYYVTKSEEDLLVFLKSVSLFGSVFLFLLFLTSFTSGLNLRSNIIKLYIFDVYGTTNSFAVFCCLLMLVLIIALFTLPSLSRSILYKLRQILLLAAVLSAGYFVLFIFSRQALLGLIVFLILMIRYFFQYGKLKTRIWCVLVLSAIFISSFAAVKYIQDYIPVSTVKLSRDALAIRSQNYDAASAGRLSIYKQLWYEIKDEVFLGNGFGKFKSIRPYLGDYENIHGLSPHNQYLGALWKMGVFPFIIYMVFLFQVYSNFWHLSKVDQSIQTRFFLYFATVFFLVLCNIQDMLTFPPTGIFFMFISGIVCKIYYIKKAVAD